MKRNILILAVIVSFIVSSCYYHKEDILYGTKCDTTHVTYSSTIKSLLNSYGCLGCHIGGSPPGGINLETYTNVKTMIDNGRLYGAITHSPGFRPMPDGAAQMNSCDINKIKAWIDAGAPNN
jgi:hypothetical protein